MGILDIIKGFFIAILGLLLTSAIVMAILANSAKSTFLEPTFYTTQLEKANAYGLLRETLVGTLVDTMVSQQLTGLPIPSATVQQMKEDTKREFASALPLSWVKAQVNGLITNGLRYVKGETAVLNMTISLKEVKPGLTTAMTNVITKYQQIIIGQIANVTNMTGMPGNVTIPPGVTLPGGCTSPAECLAYCGASDSNFAECAAYDWHAVGVDMDFSLLSGYCSSLDDCMSFCAETLSRGETTPVAVECNKLLMMLGTTGRAAGREEVVSEGGTLMLQDQRDQQWQQGGQQMQQFGAGGLEQLGQMLPDTVDLNALSNGGLKKSLDEAKEPVRQFYTAANMLILGSVVIAVLIALLAFSIKGALRHIGWPMFLGGAVTLAMAFVLPAAVEQMIAQQMRQMPSEAAAATAAVSTLATGIVGGYFDVVKGMAIPVAVGGLVLFIASFVVPLVFKKKEEGKQEERKEEKKEEKKEKKK